jgi:hypothetical protein
MEPAKKLERMFRLLNCMLLNFQALGYFLINRKARGNLVKSLFRINMCRLLMIMHHNALCTPCIALVNCGHLLHMRVDHAKPESEFQPE